MRITVFGAAGNVGSRVVAEALSRGHHVTAVVRDASRAAGRVPAGAELRTGDAGDARDVAAASAGQDVVIGATRPAPGSEGELVAMARALLAGTGESGVRLLLVGGAGNLTVPGSEGRTAVADDPAFVPPAWRPIALACTEQLAACRAAGADADWTYLSPPALLEPGVRTGTYRLGADELLVDAAGTSAISMEDLAVALLDEAERPRHRGERFTVAY
ncbi:NAD(P)H-binding protein [Streptomyces sp. SCA3-4]|uniref:NAD(P)-dependent oxidoreductase n=1 Tax=Streptomyces sichuanensis TaxID=2871810 RepID=UPI001CE353DB|nr:NAD(P)H-binding protein [Streptomyces sichuanensis]MCA6093423.1 NAD(P)H-binding protein [Streptomyces sichuanensis]